MPQKTAVVKTDRLVRCALLLCALKLLLHGSIVEYEVLVVRVDVLLTRCNLVHRLGHVFGKLS